MNERNRDTILEETRVELYELLKKTLRPEFLNRIDEVIMFTPLVKADVVRITRLQLNLIARQLERNGISLSYTDEGVARLADLGFDPQFGARPLKRVLQRNVLNELSKQILSGRVNKDSALLLDSFDGKIVFRNA
jgi:ATP-dependent Clp protease ATP-binding subunit ClpB